MRVTRRAGELQALGVDIVSFGAGEPDFPSPPVAVEAARRALAEGFTRYTPAAGCSDLRLALLERYGRCYGAPWKRLEEVAITVGAKAALLELALALFEDGDEVVIPSPSWVSIPQQVVLCDARPVPVATRFGDGFRVRADAVLEAFTSATRGVILNSPCNPTGSVLAGGDLRRIVEAAAERGIVVISDETYERFVYDAGDFTSCASLAAEFPETVVLVGSFSKTYAMTGWRIGYVLGPVEVLRAVAAVQSHATSNPTSFAMRGALAALAGAEPGVKSMVAEFRHRRDLMADGLSRLPGISCNVPGGAFYLFPRVAEHYRPGEGSAEFAELLLEEGRVAVVPGIAFGDDEHVRLSFACSRETIAEGLARMRAVLG